MAEEASQGMLFYIGYEDKQLPCIVMLEILIPNGCRTG
jgi:tRNA-binding protein